MDRITKALKSPGSMRPTCDSAPTKLPSANDQAEDLPESSLLIKSDEGYIVAKKDKLLDRGLDHIVRASGSTPVFGVIQASLVGWAFAGIAVSKHYLWPVLISDVQAILCYVFDSFLMRQEFNGYYESLSIVAQIQSRAHSTQRMFDELTRQIGPDGIRAAVLDARSFPSTDFQLPTPSRWTKFIQLSAMCIGDVVFVVFYWATIILWLAFGPANNFSNQWQLDINSATSALMVFIFSFLAILRERHADYVRACIDSIFRVDSTLELKLRVLTGNRRENLPVEVPTLKMNRVQRSILYYADIVGALTGVTILIIVIVVWITIGPAFHFNANWWLLIGTYAGLIGLIDGFILRNVQTKLQGHENPQYAQIDAQDRAIFNSLHVQPPTGDAVDTRRISYRVSQRIGKVCGHELTVVAGLMLVVGLLVGASAMRWTESGQLLCNIPPSVVESFFMIILITGHNASDAQRRVDLTNMFERRLKLLSIVDAAAGARTTRRQSSLKPNAATHASIVVHELGIESESASPV